MDTQVSLGFRLVALSGLAVFVGTYMTLAFVRRVKSAQGAALFAWLGGGSTAMGVWIWAIQYFGLRALGLPVPVLNDAAVPFSIFVDIFASGVTLLAVSGKSGSGRYARRKEPAACRSHD
jgi:NO-binding membrane sensor protein with MHYT domain